MTIATLPLPLGRLLCQRTNVAYDLRVRRTYSGILLAAASLLGVALFVVGLHNGMKMEELILTMLLPALPLATFGLKEYRKQEDTIESLTTMKSEVEKVWDKALAGASFDELTVTARALQDAIYRHRVSNPLVFDWLYSWLRKNNEDLTRHATEKLVAEAQEKLNLLVVQ